MKYPRIKTIQLWLNRIAHRLAGHGAIGYCPVCRRAIYETFTMHWDDVYGYDEFRNRVAQAVKKEVH